MQSKLTLIFILLFATSCSTTNKKVDMSGPPQCNDERIDGCKWQEGQRIQLFYDPKNADKNFQMALKQSVEDWNTALKREILVIKETSYGESYPDICTKGICFIIPETWREGSLVEGATFIKFSYKTGIIYGAKILINTKKYFYFGEKDGNKTRIDPVTLICHELGHALGLDHIDDDFDLMYESLAEKQVRQISRRDVWEFYKKYQ